MEETIKVSDLIAEALESLDIRHAFGMIGAGNVHLFESISKRGFTEIICIHHEQAATMAMQTYFRTSGRLAACLLTTGAGASNGITGILSAWADSIPGIVIAGNENSKFTKPENKLRMWGVQGFDSVDMVSKITKYASRVTAAEQAVFEIQKAANIALGERPGPCWIEIPMDIQSAKISRDSALAFNTPKKKEYRTQELAAQLEQIIDSLVKAERPLLWLGNGIRLAGAEKLIEPLLEKLGIPALVSWAGIDMVDSNHPLVFGRAGVYGQRSANFILQNCDYLLTIGTRLAIPQIGYDISELARAAIIDVVDIDEKEVQKHNSRIRFGITSDASDFIVDLIKCAGKKSISPKSQWINQCKEYVIQFPWVDVEHSDRDGFMNSYRFMSLLNKTFKDDQVIVTDMGTALLCGHQVLKLKTGQRLMTSTGLGEMGYGLPAAMGASFAMDRAEVMCLNCDGGMMLNLQELQTIVHHNLPIKIFIFNNDGYLMIKHTQNALFKKPFVATDKASGVSCPNFSKVGAAFGIPTYQINSWDECDEVINKVQSSEGPVICEVFMHPEQLFSPKLSLVAREDGTLVSPPLEDLSPLIARDVLEQTMIVGMHEKSKAL
jgi:acetolactate synthase-1/2/3 large subunit